MATSKKSRKDDGPNKKHDPDSYLSKPPSWCFLSCDTDTKCRWSFSQHRLKEEFWTRIFLKLQKFEQMTWSEIQIKSKKQNHSNIVETMNKCAKDRLDELEIEYNALFSLRLNSTVRLYGYREGAVFNILWYDNDHGDNDTCVVRSRLKHT
ncbi:MAG: hypothetical protein Q4F00_01805 [bacterium]|nr:hypothetical protein [bacterium]